MRPREARCSHRLGYVGLPLALLYVEQKFPVTGFDIDERKIDTLSKGGSYIFRIPAEEIQGAGVRGFSATADYSRVERRHYHLRSNAAHEYHEPDLSYITRPPIRSRPISSRDTSSYWRARRSGTTEESCCRSLRPTPSISQRIPSRARAPERTRPVHLRRGVRCSSDATLPCLPVS